MAVYQISRIQIRRGQKSTGTGLPQLASGELAWAIDSQELFIGNGAVSEGAPAVGNTKIITENDNLIDVIGNYQYAAGNASIQTNDNPLIPVIQSLQDVLDRTVFAENFDVRSGAGLDNASAIQRAVDQLFLKPELFNEVASGMSQFDPKLRVTLKFTPGWYDFSQTIYLPSYVTIEGSGINKTIFNYTGTGNAFEFINDNSYFDDGTGTFVRDVFANTRYISQPKHARLANFSLATNAYDVTGLLLNAVRDSEFENIEILGAWSPNSPMELTGFGINLIALSAIVTSQRNKFKNIICNKVRAGVFSKHDIFNNSFDQCTFSNSYYGISFGHDASGMEDSGEQFGPRKNRITNSVFDSIHSNGIRVELGYGNKSRGNTFIDVGNDNGNNANGVDSPIRFDVTGNSSLHDTFDRRDNIITSGDELTALNYNLSKDVKILSAGVGTLGENTITFPSASTMQLSIGQQVFGTGIAAGTVILGINDGVVTLSANNIANIVVSDYITFTWPYIPEVAGSVSYQNIEPTQVVLYRTPGPNPENKTHRGVAFRIPLTNVTSYRVDYLFHSELNLQARKGHLSIAIDLANNAVQLSDDFEFTGTAGEDERVAFAAEIVNDSLVVYYTNINSDDGSDAILKYTYTMLI